LDFFRQRVREKLFVWEMDNTEAKRSPSRDKTDAIIWEVYIFPEHQNEVNPAIAFPCPCFDAIKKRADAIQSTHNEKDYARKCILDGGVNLICGFASFCEETPLMFGLGGLPKRLTIRYRRKDAGLCVAEDDRHVSNTTTER